MTVEEIIASQRFKDFLRKFDIVLRARSRLTPEQEKAKLKAFDKRMRP